MEYVVAAAPQPSLPVAGTQARYPVRRVYCVGRNYLAHIREFGNDEKALPFFFAKAPDMIVESGTTVPYPPLTQNFQHEVELVAAIGKTGANIPAEKALDYVYGYAIGFDMTRRDLQQIAAKSGRPWDIGKSFDHAAPCGAIYPVAQVGHFTEGEIKLTVNGQVRQQSDVNLLIWDVAHIIHHLSQQVTLATGDLIYTGTPEGVGPVVSGDTIVGHIAKLGELTIHIA
ncbi:MAG: FAA hydrolase family protein [Bryobacterales bacterium]|nr:FAA hydrolase family protein [Bryobacterales bacterium]